MRQEQLGNGIPIFWEIKSAFRWVKLSNLPSGRVLSWGETTSST